MGDLKRELKVHVTKDLHQRSMRGSELSLVTVVRILVFLTVNLNLV